MAGSNREGGASIFKTALPGIELPRFEAEIETARQVQFEAGNFISFDEQVLDPDLNAIDNANHLQAQAEMRDRGAQGTGQHQVSVQRRANLLGAQSAQGQSEDGVPRQNRGERLCGIAQPGNGFFCDCGSQVLGNANFRGEWCDSQPGQYAGRGVLVRTHFGQKPVTALVDSLDAVVRLQAGAQGREAFGHGVRSDVDIAP